MGIRSVIVFVITYLFGLFVKKWPALEKIPNDIIPQITYIVSILTEALAGYVSPTPAQAAESSPIPGVPFHDFLAGTLNWGVVQLFDLGIRKWFFGKVLKIKW